MKRVIPTLLAAIASLALASIDAGAQEEYFSRKPVVSVGWGGYPLLDSVSLTDAEHDTYRNPTNLDSIYRKSYGAKHITSLISVTCDIPILSWLSIPVVGGFDIGWRPCTDFVTNTEGTEYSASLKLLAGARFNYFRRPHFGIYSAVLAGLEIADLPDPEIFPAFQLTFFGMRVGGRLFGFAETGLGTMYVGGMVGVGFKF